MADVDPGHAHSIESLQRVLDDCLQNGTTNLKLTRSDVPRVVTFRLPIIGNLLDFRISEDGSTIILSVAELKRLLDSIPKMLEHHSAAKAFALAKVNEAFIVEQQEIEALRDTNPEEYAARKTKNGAFFCSVVGCEKHIDKFGAKYRGYIRPFAAVKHYIDHHSKQYAPALWSLVYVPNPLVPHESTLYPIPADGTLPQEIVEQRALAGKEKRKANARGPAAQPKQKKSKPAASSVTTTSASTSSISTQGEPSLLDESDPSRVQVAQILAFVAFCVRPHFSSCFVFCDGRMLFCSCGRRVCIIWRQRSRG